MLKKVNHILNSQTKTFTFAAILLGVSSLISGFLGLARDKLLAAKFGAGGSLDIYFTAFRIPDFAYVVLLAGGIISAFLPVFAEYYEEDPKRAWRLTNNVLNCFLILLVFVCLLLFIFTPLIINFIAPGFNQEQKDLAAKLTRIMFLSPILFGLSNIFSGVLQYFNRFLAFSLAPVLYNFGIIFGILFLVPRFGLSGLALGVILGAFLHFIVQIPGAGNSGYRYFPAFNFRDKGFLSIFKLMIPRIIGSASQQINLIVITAIASTLASGSIAIFNFSNNLQWFPVTIIGVSFASASFPILSKSWAANNKEKFLENFSSVFRQILFLAIPAGLLMFILRAQIVRIILGAGKFGWVETRLTAASLGVFSLAVFSIALIPLISRTFFSFKNTKTPALISFFSIALNIILALLLTYFLKFPNGFQKFIVSVLRLEGIKNIEVVGLALALSLSGFLQFSLLLFFLKKKIGDFKQKEIFRSLKKIFLASAVMIFFVFFVRQVTANFVDMQTFPGVFWQTVLSALAGVIIYLISAAILKLPELTIIKLSVLKQFSRAKN